MRTLIFVFFLLISLPFFAAAEGYFGGGVDLNILPEQEPVLAPELFLNGGGDFFFPAGRKWSFFLTAGGEFSFFPVETNFSGKASVTGDVSYRGNLFFGKLQLGSYFEHANWWDNPYWFQHAELYTSIDFKKISLYAAPQFIWKIEENNHIPGVEGRLGCSLDLGRVVLSPEFNGGIHFLPDNGRELLYGPNIEFSWYPGLPFMVNGSAGFKRMDSTVTEVLVEGEGEVPTDNASSIYIKPQGSFFFSKLLTMEVHLPFTYILKNYGYMENGLMQTDNEFRTIFAPELIFTFDVSGPLSFELSGGIDILRSNSAYLNSGSGNVSISTDISF